MSEVTATREPTPASSPADGSATIKARNAGFLHDLATVAGRAIRDIPREPESVIPALIVPLFFFIVNIGALQDLAESQAPGFDFKAFQLPVAIIFAVTGVSRAGTLVTDIQNGYFDRLLATPVSRRALLLGMMLADFVLVVALSIPVVIMGFAVGVRFETGVAGVVVFLLIGGLWGLVFTGFPYAIALKTGSPAAVNSSFILFFPFAFLTTSFLPQEALTGWLSTIADYNPVTYLLAALRSLVSEGWEWRTLAEGLAAVAAVGVLTQTLAFKALKGRVSSK
ncbi:MAG: ABC transporter permease [Actinomycetota bacterium]